MGWGGQPHAPATSTPGKDPVLVLQEAGWAPGSIWTADNNNNNNNNNKFRFYNHYKRTYLSMSLGHAFVCFKISGYALTLTNKSTSASSPNFELLLVPVRCRFLRDGKLTQVGGSETLIPGNIQGLAPYRSRNLLWCSIRRVQTRHTVTLTETFN